MLIRELIEKLSELPPDWRISGTRAGSLEIWDPKGDEYGYVFTDGRAPRMLRARRVGRGHAAQKGEGVGK